MAKLRANITVLGTAAMPASTKPQKPQASPAVMPAKSWSLSVVHYK